VFDRAPLRKRSLRVPDEASQAVQWAGSARSGRADADVLLEERVLGALNTRGQPIGTEARAVMEPHFGFDFSQVRIFPDGHPAQSAHMLGAEAYTVGSNIVFGSGRYEPGTPGGQRLLAHELAHVVQQSTGPVAGVSLTPGLAVSTPGDPFEQAADQAADRVMSASAPRHQVPPSPIAAQTTSPRTLQAFWGMPNPGASAKASGDKPASGEESSKEAPAPKPTGPEPGLNTTEGRLTDWAVAVNALNSQWTGISGIGAKQKEAVQNWYDLASKDDPPPAWHALLVTAVSIAAGGATAGIGAIITNRLVGSQTGSMLRFFVNGAVTAGKDTAKAVAAEFVGAAVALHRYDGLMAYKKSLQDTVSKTVDTQAGRLANSMNGLATKDPADRWSGMQQLYDACELAKPSAYQLQLMEAIEGWLNMQAMENSGTVQQIGGTDILRQTGLEPFERVVLEQAVRSGITDSLPDYLVKKLEKLYGEKWKQALGVRVDVEEIADENDVSQVGTLGFYLHPGDDPSQPMIVGSVQMEGSKGNTAQIRNVLLASSKTIAQLKIPKSVKTDDLQAGSGHDNKYGWFEVAWPHDNSTYTLFTRGAGFFTHDASDDNAGRVWLAMYGKKSRDIADAEITPYVHKGIARLEKELLHKTFAELHVSKILT
jgi:hypothetical protein